MTSSLLTLVIGLFYFAYFDSPKFPINQVPCILALSNTAFHPYQNLVPSGTPVTCPTLSRFACVSRNLYFFLLFFCLLRFPSIIPAASRYFSSDIFSSHGRIGSLSFWHYLHKWFCGDSFKYKSVSVAFFAACEIRVIFFSNPILPVSIEAVLKLPRFRTPTLRWAD